MKKTPGMELETGVLEQLYTPDYEYMYNALNEEHKRLCADHAELKKDYEGLETEFVRMRSQLDIVYLIFGK